MAGGGTDRLVDASTLSGQPPVSDVNASDDVFDEQNNLVAQNLGRMVNASSKTRRDQLVAQMKQVSKDATPAPQSAKAPAEAPGSVIPNPLAVTPLNKKSPASTPEPTPPTPQPGLATFSGKLVTPDLSAVQKKTPAEPPKTSAQLTEEELLEKIHAEAAKPKNYGHLHVVKPIKEQEAEAAAKAKAEAAKAAARPVTPKPDPDIIQLANNDDLNVETIARQANKKKGKNQPPPGEVVIKLH
jgi:hypothetical protein